LQSGTVGRRNRHPGLVFSGGLDGRLRAYSAGDGRIVWEVDTKGDYRTVNGIAVKGG
jgi:polyvinyl alcohol dehydrogenase (cytochrome)